MADAARPSLTPGFVVLALGLSLGGLYLVTWNQDQAVRDGMLDMQRELKELRADRARRAQDAAAEADRHAAATTAENEGLKLQVQSLEALAHKRERELDLARDATAKAAAAAAAELAAQRKRYDDAMFLSSKRIAEDEETIAKLREQLETSRGQLEVERRRIAQQLEAAQQELKDTTAKLEQAQAALADARRAGSAGEAAAMKLGQELEAARRTAAEARAAARKAESTLARMQEQRRPDWHTLPFPGGPVLGRVVAVRPGSPALVYMEVATAAIVLDGDTVQLFAWDGDRRETPRGTAVIKGVLGDVARLEVASGDAAALEPGLFVRKP